MMYNNYVVADEINKPSRYFSHSDYCNDVLARCFEVKMKKICKQCGKEYSNRNKFFCSKTCVGLSQRTKFKKKYCLNCGNEIKRKVMPGGLMVRTSTFKQLKFCCYKCSVDHRVKNQKKHVSYKCQSIRAKKFKKDFCEDCGVKGGRLHTHHINHNRGDNTAENIKTLCSKCHNKEHWSTNWNHRKQSPVCTVCGEKSHVKGLCVKHYMRDLRHGDVHKVLKPRKEGKK